MTRKIERRAVPELLHSHNSGMFTTYQKHSIADGVIHSHIAVNGNHYSEETSDMGSTEGFYDLTSLHWQPTGKAMRFPDKGAICFNKHGLQEDMYRA